MAKFGILFRVDSKLFDAGYVTVTPQHRLEVNRRIKEEFENGRGLLRPAWIHDPASGERGPSASRGGAAVA